MKRYKFRIIGLDCANCANELEEEIRKCGLVQEVVISFMMETLSFLCDSKDYDEALVMIKKIINDNEPTVKIEEL